MDVAKMVDRGEFDGLLVGLVRLVGAEIGF